MHCNHKAMRKVRKAATTMPKVTHTSFRKVDFFGATRKYDTRIDTLTKVDARTKRVWLPIDACTLSDDGISHNKQRRYTFRPFCTSGMVASQMWTFHPYSWTAMITKAVVRQENICFV